ncbi:hypothetical protein SAMN05444339_102245 [Loktanella atrilutea]|uniref:Cytochrome c domain-containing protein n=1 Tax=Loktanella atrilutea TaxID=366533 RepID=A0A1M4WV90_LOKAT|nr:c-type cytochrome [Loktanella atrilutea]SHE85159.1 hypothetical protein SAMN05444339_102245 [Loktanella atrilutea]
MKHVLKAAILGLTATGAMADVSVERGEYLVTGPMGCGNCHTPQGADGPIPGAELSGMLVDQNPGFTAIASNITPAGDIADWSDDELAKAIREGIRPDGSVIGPPMPIGLYRHISDDDLGSIVAYLRTVHAVENDPGKSVYNIPLPPAYGPPLTSVSAPAEGETAEWGGYVASISHCFECHSTPVEGVPDLAGHYGQGGLEFAGPWGVSVAPDITAGEDGIGKYSDADLAAMIQHGIRPDGNRMLPPMPYPYLAKMTDQDLSAVILYLRSGPTAPPAEM